MTYLYCDIYGEPTRNPDACCHCATCGRILTADDYREEAECRQCGADMTKPKSIITGRMLRQAQEAVDKDWAEWIALQPRPKPRNEP